MVFIHNRYDIEEKLCTQNDDVAVLIETEEDDLQLVCDSKNFETMSPLYFSERGFHVIQLRPRTFANHLRFRAEVKYSK